MKTRWTKEIKPTVVNHLISAGFTPKDEVYKKVLKLRKSINTLHGMLYHNNYVMNDRISCSDALLAAEDSIEVLNGNGFPDNPPLYDDWKKYCEISGTHHLASISDFLA